MEQIAQPDAITDPFEPEIEAFEEADRINPPPKGEIVCVGSSTFTFWYNINRDFPGFTMINRGFGGSNLSDSTKYAHRIVIPYEPRQVLLYAGDNDIGGGMPAALVARDFRRFVDVIHGPLPEAVVTFISIKPSILRWDFDDEIREANQRIKAYVAATPKTSYIDCYYPTLDETGELRRELYVDDGLHLNRKGYRLWASIIMPHLIPK